MSTQSLTDFLTSIGNDAELRGRIFDIRDEASAEDFAPRVAALATEKGYTVTIEEISEAFSKEIPDEKLAEVSAGFLICYKVNGNTTCHIR